jgi:hypothetical protein
VNASEENQERSNMSLERMTKTALEKPALIDPMDNPLDIFASVRIQAEIWRLLYALSTPEYMEAWVQLPGTERVECHSEGRSFDRFRIDMFSANKKLGSIYGSCLLSKPNRVTYLWHKQPMEIRSRSMVEIHLLGGVNCCALKLKHRGLTKDEDRELYSKMWQLSLEKLRILMERINSEKAFAT